MRLVCGRPVRAGALGDHRDPERSALGWALAGRRRSGRAVRCAGAFARAAFGGGAFGAWPGGAWVRRRCSGAWVGRWSGRRPGGRRPGWHGWSRRSLGCGGRSGNLRRCAGGPDVGQVGQVGPGRRGGARRRGRDGRGRLVRSRRRGGQVRRRRQRGGGWLGAVIRVMPGPSLGSCRRHPGPVGRPVVRVPRAPFDRAARDQAAPYRTARDWAALDRAALGRAALGRTARDWTARDWTARDWAARDRAARDQASGLAALDRTVSDRVAPDRAALGRAACDWAALYRSSRDLASGRAALGRTVGDRAAFGRAASGRAGCGRRLLAAGGGAVGDRPVRLPRERLMVGRRMVRRWPLARPGRVAGRGPVWTGLVPGRLPGTGVGPVGNRVRPRRSLAAGARPSGWLGPLGTGHVRHGPQPGGTVGRWLLRAVGARTEAGRAVGGRAVAGRAVGGRAVRRRAVGGCPVRRGAVAGGPGAGRAVPSRTVRAVAARAVGGRVVRGRVVGGRVVRGRAVGGCPVRRGPVAGGAVRAVAARAIGGRAVWGRAVRDRSQAGGAVAGRVLGAVACRLLRSIAARAGRHRSQAGWAGRLPRSVGSGSVGSGSVGTGSLRTGSVGSGSVGSGSVGRRPFRSSAGFRAGAGGARLYGPLGGSGGAVVGDALRAFVPRGRLVGRAARALRGAGPWRLGLFGLAGEPVGPVAAAAQAAGRRPPDRRHDRVGGVHRGRSFGWCGRRLRAPPPGQPGLSLCRCGPVRRRRSV